MLVKIDKREALCMLADRELSKKLYVKKQEDYYRAGRFIYKFEKGFHGLGAIRIGGLDQGVSFSTPLYFHNQEFYKRIDIDAVQKEGQQ
ncbi:hypothetical protein EUAN_07070 [Andreesenia angusta]|uniref:Uncharacterized protein n=1 Tax=Andreesenia angusta TaxID=39480 RepID=A0A1S1V8J4_9FIRM|nr:hypothetical protein [Andreesenia angusta]OHW62923.1 hypothetical protein EUAN_07070 [Andreesenia angusta]